VFFENGREKGCNIGWEGQVTIRERMETQRGKGLVARCLEGRTMETGTNPLLKGTHPTSPVKGKHEPVQRRGTVLCGKKSSKRGPENGFGALELD